MCITSRHGQGKVLFYTIVVDIVLPVVPSEAVSHALTLHVET